MKVLIISTDSCGLSFAWRCAQAGHQVRWFLKPDDTNNQECGIGFKGVERIDNWVASVKWADLIVPTSNDDYVQRMDFFKARGAKVFGPSGQSTALEIKRAKGMEFLEEHGIECPEFKTFKTLKDAEDFVWANEERWVFKTLGDNEDKSLSYCSDSPADMIARLQRWQKLKMNPKGEVMLQKFIPGIEFAVSSWMGSGGFVGKPNSNFEFKKCLSGDMGQNCGEAGTAIKYVSKCKLFDTVLKPLEKSLLKMGHLGDIDVNCIIDEKGKAWPLEFTSRMGWPAFNIMMATHKGDPVKWMLDACNGKDSTDFSSDHALGVVVAQPDYPFSNATKKETTGIPIYGVTKKNVKYLHPQSVKMEKLPDMEGGSVVEREIWSTAGDYLIVVTGTGNSVSQAAKRCYATVDELSIPDMIVRDDVGESLEKKIPELQKHGYATEFTYDQQKLAKAA